MNKPKRALSIRQPYAEMILRGTKKLEYRTIPTNIRERVYIYASKTPGEEENFKKLKVDPGDLPVGVLVGTIEIIGCTWRLGKYEWHLAKPERLAKPLEPENRPQPVWFYPFKVENYSIPEFIHAIQRLPADKPKDNPKVRYKTQKEHWLCWLKEYDGPGAYDRIPGQGRDARYAYNHIVCHKMLLWIIEAAGLSSDLVENARRAAEKVNSMQQKSAAIRKYGPWEKLAEALKL
jgi:ASCH domain